MNTLTIGICAPPPGRSHPGTAAADADGGATLWFASADALFKTITTRRWRILCALVEQPRLGVPAIARRIGHDPKTVHRDVEALIRAKIISQDEKGRIVLPFESVRVAFTLDRAADNAERGAPGAPFPR